MSQKKRQISTKIKHDFFCWIVEPGLNLNRRSTKEEEEEEEEKDKTPLWTVKSSF